MHESLVSIFLFTGIWSLSLTKQLHILEITKSLLSVSLKTTYYSEAKYMFFGKKLRTFHSEPLMWL